MNQHQSAFLTAFWAGLASPICAFAAPQTAVPAIMSCTLAGTFATVGATLSRSLTAQVDDGHVRTTESEAA